MPRSMPATMRETDSSSTPASSMETVAKPTLPLQSQRGLGVGRGGDDLEKQPRQRACAWLAFLLG